MTTVTSPSPLATVLTIAGSDSSAGAGIQADLKTIHALGGYALTAITAITAQNSQGVQQVFSVPASQLKAQLTSLLADYQIDAIKIGMLGNAEKVHVVAKVLQANPQIPAVLDPIILSSSSQELLNQEAMSLITQELLPLVELITPNIPELNALLNTDFKGSAKEIPQMLDQLKQRNWPNTLVKGGHSIEALSIDYLLIPQATEESNNQSYAFPAPRITTDNNHGTGCTLSSAIATQLAYQRQLPEAVQLAKNYLQNALITADYAQPKYKQKTPETVRHGGLNHLGQSRLTHQDEEE
ncbi:MAG: bifunctional hydroxymethylpyrimidine kinase/phosphomethylpyrimidine kinase [Thiomicrorhabdus sp.]|nr:bifunctional hydroxymethylpyrimidine kinase/phosphomethylpyrimidine kinase [Thiomicrorhabdus sp.]